MVEPRYLVPNAVTLANISCGFGSMLLAADGHYEAAVYLLVIAIVLDMSDGILARALHATSRFGQELDSFSDALSFGAAPAFLVYQAILRPLGPSGVTLAVVYLLCGVLRLARFNVTTDAHAKDRRTCGVPIPIAGGYLMILALMRDQVPQLAAAGLVLTMAGLMVSRVALPQLKGPGPVPAMLLVGLASFMAVVFAPNWYTVGWWNVWNVCILVVARAGERSRGLDLAST
jgi:CDP-diacylglycerol--serine O-phosphatidyltransferase